MPRRMTQSSKSVWLLPLSLVLLTLIPVVAGSLRVAQLVTSAPVTPDNARFFQSPTPVVLDILCASAFCVLGALQVTAALRRRWPNWHRRAGRALAACGAAAGATGSWMTLFYPHVPGDTAALLLMRLVVGPGLVLCMAAGIAAARRRDFDRHRAWMLRGYAIGMGAGTQAVLHLPWLLAHHVPGELGRTLLMGAGWGINLLVAEWAIRGRSAPSTELAAQSLDIGRA